MLESVLSRFPVSENGGNERGPRIVRPWPSSGGRQVFIVHGHAEAAREKVARFLERCDLEPIILHEQVNQGRTIIEKFEAYSDVGFAVVLLTPDDMVGDTRRARQNVIFEMGYFAGKLGRRHVAALVADGVDIPSDLHGVVYIRLDDAGAWRFGLARELRDAGLPVDAERVLS